ncbi:hypothetical protein LguiA_019321 [Lonicera macranthoides]
MDRRLLEAAWIGEVEYLFKLLEEDRFILHTVALAGGETPLHVACLAGHLDFVKEVLKLKKEFATELNQDGFAPLHIAASNGHVEIVKEILKTDGNLCRLEGRGRMIPLHYAVIKGRVDVIKELLSACVDSIENLTARGETTLHLAVNNHQFQAFKVLVEYLKEFQKEDLLNGKDGQGNTILHLAVSRKQYEVIDLVLNEHNVTRGTMEVNSLNKMALSPLDVLLQFQSEAGDREIEDLLRQAGAMRAKDLPSLSVQVPDAQDLVDTNGNALDEQLGTNRPQSSAEQLLDYFKYDNVKDSPSKVRNTLLVIVILIATATYQAVLSPPGGLWQDDSTPSSSSNNITNSTNTTVTITRPHSAGRAIMGTQNSVAYGLFIFFNSVGFFTALHMIYFLTPGFPMRLELQVLLFALAVTYDTSMAAIIQNNILSLLFTGISIVLPLTIPITTAILRNYLRRPRDTLASTNQIGA